MNKRFTAVLLICLLALAALAACGLPGSADQTGGYPVLPDESVAGESAGPDDPAAPNGAVGDVPGEPAESAVSENGQYSDPESVALYLHSFGHLPDNYLTKAEAEALGWDNSQGNLWEVAPGSSIGGDRFGNREGLLPTASGRQYYECDVNYAGGFRGGERIVWSNDGLIFYSNDHYASYTQLY